ncbi:MAG: hypothetical protein KDB03_07350 [Planctomycetales bacterium]|nr:hypothetical protein [Planctomycetales bacterium]
MSVTAWSPRRWFIFAAVILTPTLLISLSFDPWLMKPAKPTGDGLEYDAIAFSLQQGRGFSIDTRQIDWRHTYDSTEQLRAEYKFHLDSPVRTLPATGRPPLWPAIMSGIYLVAGRTPTGFALIRSAEALCIALAGALATALAAQVLRDYLVPTVCEHSRFNWITFCTNFSPTVVIFFFVTNRTLVSYTTDFLTEPLALLLTQVFINFCYQLCGSEGKRSMRLIFLCGLTLGMMILTRSLFLLWLPGIWLIVVCITQGSYVHKLRLATILIIVACVVCGPWWIHNCWQLNRWMPLGTQGPITLLGGYSDQALASTSGDWQFGPEQELRSTLAHNRLFQQAANDTSRELMVVESARSATHAWILKHLQDLPTLAWKRIITHWNPYSGPSLIWKAMALVGAAVVIRANKRVSCLLLGLPILSTLVVAAIYTTGGRFLIPLYGLLFCLAAIGWAGLGLFSEAAKPSRN